MRQTKLNEQSGRNMGQLLAEFTAQQAGWLMSLSSEQNKICMQFPSHIACQTYADFFRSQCPSRNTTITITEEAANFYLEINAGNSPDLANLLNGTTTDQHHEFLRLLHDLYVNKLYTLIVEQLKLSNQDLATYLATLSIEQLIRCERVFLKTTGVKISGLQQYFSNYLAASVEALTLHSQLCDYFQQFLSQKLIHIRIQPNNFILLETNHPILGLALQKVLDTLKIGVEFTKNNGIWQVNIPFSKKSSDNIAHFLTMEKSKRRSAFLEYIIAYLKSAISVKIEQVNKNEAKRERFERGILVSGLEQLLESLNSDSTAAIQFSHNDDSYYHPLSLEHCLMSYEALATYASTGERRATLNKQIRDSFFTKMERRIEQQHQQKQEKRPSPKQEEQPSQASSPLSLDM